MKWTLILLTLVFVRCAFAQDSAQRELVFRNVSVLPMDKEEVLADQTVVIRGGKVIALGATGKVRFDPMAQIIDGRGKFLMPGLAEMHAHVPPVDDLEPMKEVVALFAVKGITTIRGMLGHPRHLELRSKIASGEILGPRLITSGPSFNGNSVKTPEDAERLVRAQKAAGYDFMKIHPGLSLPAFEAMVRTARAEGRVMAGHVPFAVGLHRVLAAPFASVEHLDGFMEALLPPGAASSEEANGLFGLYLADKVDTTLIPELMDTLRRSGSWLVPTQSLAERWFSPIDPEVFRQAPEMKYMAPSTVNNWVQAKRNLMRQPAYDSAAVNRYIQLRRRLLLACQLAGVRLLLGSDAPQVFDVPGFSTHQELGYLVQSGLTPYQALRTGTVHVGQYLNRPDIGVIRPGAAADLLLLSANPLQNIQHTERIEGVLLGGRWLSSAFIRDTLESLEKK